MVSQPTSEGAEEGESEKGFKFQPDTRDLIISCWRNARSVFPVVIQSYPYRWQFSLSHQTLQFERPALVTSGVRFVNAVDFMAKHASSVYVYCVCYIPDLDC